MQERLVRVVAILGAVVAFALAACALHHPVNVTPGWPEESPLGAPRDAGCE